MNPLPSSASVGGLQGIGQRHGQKPRGDADAFRRALQGEGEQGAEAGADPGSETPKARGLQPRPPARRKEPAGAVRHVDVLA
jgi:hypothetical protein